MSYSTIQEYINYLIENQININIIDFVKEINKLNYNIDISFIDKFIELVSKDECCIHHNMLQKYAVSSLKGGTSDIKKLLDQNNFIENEDFRLRNVSESASKGGCTHKNEYYLSPEAFKICLMRSKNTKIYSKYYLLLEKCIKYYNDYQIELQIIKNQRFLIICSKLKIF
jgi:phage anti-repressor protein